MADSQIDILVKLQDQASKEIADLNTHIGKLGDTVKGSAPSFLTMASAVAVGQAALAGVKWVAREFVDGFKQVTSAAMEAEDANAKMTQTLENSGKVSKEEIENLKNWAQAEQYKTGIDDEALKSGIAMLGTFKLSGQTIKDTIPALENLAVMYKRTTGEQVGIADWAMKIGKAEALPELASQLRRVGIVFDDNQIKMMKNGTEAERVATIVQELNAEFGGLAERMAKTTSGRIQIMKLAFSELEESIGGALLTGLAPFIEKLSKWASSDKAQQKIADIGKKVGEMTTIMVDWVQTVAIPWVQKHWPDIKRVTLEVVDAIGKAIQFIKDNRVAFEVFVATLVALDVVGKLAGIVTGFKLMATIISSLPTMVAIGIAIDVALIWNAVNAAKSLRKEVEGMDQKTKDAWHSSMSWNEKAVSWLTGSYASGTDYAAGGLSLVGENGPEIVNLPKGSQVIPNNKISQGVTININGNINNSAGYTPEEIARILGRQLELSRFGVAT